MSKSLESLVWKSDLNPELKPIAAVMADMGNDDGLGIYPSVAYLAWLLGRSERFIQSGLKKLCKMGVLDRVSNAAGGRGLTPRYRLSGESLPERPTWDETRKGEICAPFRKGAIHDQKGANGSEKGARFAPDPSVDPLLNRERAPALVKPVRKTGKEESLLEPKFATPPSGFKVTSDMRSHVRVSNSDLTDVQMDKCTPTWMANRKKLPKPKRYQLTAEGWEWDWIEWMTRQTPGANGNGYHSTAQQEQPRMKTLREQMQERGEIA